MNIGDMYKFGNTYWICNRIYSEPYPDQTIFTGKITNNDDPDVFYFNIDKETIKIGLSHSSVRTYEAIEKEKAKLIGSVSEEELLKFFEAERRVFYYSVARKAFRNGDFFYKGSLLKFSDNRCFAVIKRDRSIGMIYGYEINPNDGMCLSAKMEERVLSKWSPIGTLKYKTYQILYHLRNFDSNATIRDFDSIYEKL